VPPALTSAGIGKLPEGWRYLAIHGVGEIRAASDDDRGAMSVREWAEGVGGHLVLTKSAAAESTIDPWGTPPPGLDIQRALIAQFDPVRVVNPGRLPGGL
jgi:hypothetical protein